MKQIIFIVFLTLFIFGCTNKNVYEMAASHQCQEQEKHAADPNPARCMNEKELDGRDYESYKREKEEIERDYSY